jgi:hypothetical protein
MLIWDRYRIHKKHTKTCDAKLVFLHPMGSAGLVVHSGASFGLHKKRTGTRYAKVLFFHPVGFVGHVVHSGVSGVRNIGTPFVVFGWDR